MKPIILDDQISFDFSEELWLDTKKYIIYYYNFWNFQKLLKYIHPNINKFIRLFYRGFTDGTHIYALDKHHPYSKIKHNRLILHEISHIKGNKHKWHVFDVMHPYWIFRWSDRIW